MLAIQLSATLLLVLARPGPSADVFVDVLATGCAGANGSISQPYCSISDALAVAVDGDRILIRPGTYHENLLVAADLELVGLFGDQVTVVDGGAAGTTVTIPSNKVVTLNGLTIRGGRGTQAGGVFSRGPLTLRNCTVSGNESTGPFSAGGCVVANRSSLIEGCVFEGNVGFPYFYSASAIWSNGAGSTVMTVANSTISGNTSSGPIGAAVFAYDSDLVLRDSTVSGNRGAGVNMFGYGASGGLYAASIEGSTIVQNDASGLPFGTVSGGIDEYGTFPVSIQNTVVAGNIGTGPAPDVNGSFQSIGGNLIGVRDGSIGLNTSPSDQAGTAAAPLPAGLTPLGHFGGRTRTHSPMGVSLALDAGIDQPTATADQRGVPHPAGSRDVGAHERGVGISQDLCVPALNSTGRPTRLEASANLDPAQNSMFLTMLDMPRDAFGFCITSPSLGAPVQPTGSQGFLCLSGAIGRLIGPGQVSASGSLGRIQVTLDLSQHPTPAGSVMVLSGETWYFQGWHRDVLPGSATSNFSSTIGVTFL